MNTGFSILYRKSPERPVRFRTVPMLMYLKEPGVFSNFERNRVSQLNRCRSPRAHCNFAISGRSCSLMMNSKSCAYTWPRYFTL